MFNFSRFPTLSTQRLLLREITPADAKSIFALRSDFQVTRFNNAHPYTVLQQAYDLIVAFREDFKDKKTIRWGITIKDDNAVVGVIGYNYWNKADSRASVGYDLAKAYWGNGYITEAMRMVVAFGFHQMMLNRIEAECGDFNPASMRVLEKLNFDVEGRQRERFFQAGQPHDLILYGLLRSKYLARDNAINRSPAQLPDNWSIT